MVVAAYQWLIEAYEEGDDLYIFGFSRGAFKARSLAGFISRCGVIKLGASLSIKQLYDRYRQGDYALTLPELRAQADKSGFDFEENWMVKYCLFPLEVLFNATLASAAKVSQTPGVSALWYASGADVWLVTKKRTCRYAPK